MQIGTHIRTTNTVIDKKNHLINYNNTQIRSLQFKIAHKIGIITKAKILCTKYCLRQSLLDTTSVSQASKCLFIFSVILCPPNVLLLPLFLGPIPLVVTVQSLQLIKEHVRGLLRYTFFSCFLGMGGNTYFNINLVIHMET